MNCFHFWVSLRYNTTISYCILLIYTLWIAFIFEYLWDTTQRLGNIGNVLAGCELLSFLSIFEIQHNSKVDRLFKYFVVNCFHFWVSLRYNTTNLLWILLSLLLWIAFIFEYLWDTTQLSKVLIFMIHCCELLSFLSIFEIQHNV